MACLISKDAQNQVSFKNAGALIYIIVKNIPAGYTRAILTSQGTDAPDIAGNVEITFTAEGIPTLKTLTNSNVTEVSGTDNKVGYQLILQFPMLFRTWNSTSLSLSIHIRN